MQLLLWSTYIIENVLQCQSILCTLAYALSLEASITNAYVASID